MAACDETVIQDYLLGALPSGRAAEFEDHVRGCPSCSRRLEEFRALFQDLASLPLPAVPQGIADAVIRRLGRRRALVVAGLLDRPIGVAFAGSAVGLCLAIFRHPLILLFGRLTHGFVTSGSAELLRGLRILLHDLMDVTVLIHTMVGVLTNAGSLSRQIETAVPAAGLSLVLFLITALLLGRVFGHLGREKLGHAKR